MSASVPRVASSLDDLRVGQVVAWLDESTGRWECSGRPLRLGRDDFLQRHIEMGIVILSDPPDRSNA